MTSYHIQAPPLKRRRAVWPVGNPERTSLSARGPYDAWAAAKRRQSSLSATEKPLEKPPKPTKNGHSLGKTKPNRSNPSSKPTKQNKPKPSRNHTKPTKSIPKFTKTNPKPSPKKQPKRRHSVGWKSAAVKTYWVPLI